jgi:hypothetical protein
MDGNQRHLLGLGFFAGIGLNSLATLMLQVSLTRLFSVALWHHFAFMVVSIAFLGYGASGTLLMMVPRIKTPPLRPTLACLALGFSMATLAAYWCSNIIPFDPARIIWDRYQWIYLMGYCGVLATPFFFAGLILALAYTRRSESVNRLYACDLAGAGLGCIALFLVYSFTGEVGAVLLICLFSASASFAFSANGWKINLVRIPWLLIVCLLLIVRPGFLDLNISPYKALRVALRYPGARTLETRWHPAARIDVIESRAARFAPGLSLEFQGSLPEQLGLCLDAGHLNAVTRFAGDVDELSFTASLPASLPYVIGKPNRVLIMEPLGGLDILTARYHGANNIVTTHANPLVLRIMEDSLREFSGKLYEKEAMAVEQQARSFLLRATERFDVIQLPLTDSLGAASSGLYGLSENYRLTLDAFKAYISALTPGGVLTVTKYLLPPPRHEIRLVALACEALEAMGVKHPAQHIGAIRSWGTFTLLIKRSPFKPQEIDRIKSFCRRLRFDLVCYPEMKRAEANKYNRFPSPLYYDIVQRVLDPLTREAFYSTYLFDVRPVTDDRPFFYHNFRMDKVVPLYRAVGNKWQLFLEGGYLIHLIFIQAALISLILITLPFRKAGRLSSSWFLAYFGLIGMAFMLTEICLIQRFILFLTRPVYAFAVVLFSVLVASAIGSYYSRKVTLQGSNGELLLKKLLGRIPVLLLTPVLLLAYAFLLHKLLTPATAWPLWIRCGVAFFVILPLGFMMGTFFPSGVRALSQRLESAIPWAWAANASGSVVGSVLAVLIALSYGFTTVLCLAAVAYGLAAFVLCLMMRRTNP